MIILIYVLDPLALGPHSDNFGGFKHCSSGWITFLICNVFSKDHAFKGLPDLMRKPLIISHQRSPFITLIFRVTFQDHLVNASSNFMEGSSSLYVTIMPGLMALDIMAVEL